MSRLMLLPTVVLVVSAAGCVRSGYTYAYYPDHGVYYAEHSHTYYWYEDGRWHDGPEWEGAELGGFYTVSSIHEHPRYDFHGRHYHHH